MRKNISFFLVFVILLSLTTFSQLLFADEVIKPPEILGANQGPGLDFTGTSVLVMVTARGYDGEAPSVKARLEGVSADSVYDTAPYSTDDGTWVYMLKISGLTPSTDYQADVWATGSGGSSPETTISVRTADIYEPVNVAPSFIACDYSLGGNADSSKVDIYVGISVDNPSVVTLNPKLTLTNRSTNAKMELAPTSASSSLSDEGSQASYSFEVEGVPLGYAYDGKVDLNVGSGEELTPRTFTIDLREPSLTNHQITYVDSTTVKLHFTFNDPSGKSPMDPVVRGLPGTVTVETEAFDFSGSATMLLKGVQHNTSYTITFGVFYGYGAAEKVQTINYTHTEPSSMWIDPHTVHVNTGSSSQLHARFSNNSTTALNWSSSNSNIATVSSSGLVRGVATGTVTITAAESAGTRKATLSVTVNALPVIRLDASTMKLVVGEQKDLKPSYSQSDEIYGDEHSAHDPYTTWSTDKASVATVSSNGRVTAVAAGEAIITATWPGTNSSATCKVTVENVSKRFVITRDDYRFSNSRASFGYSNTYRIPLERYTAVFGQVNGTYLYERDTAWGGSCYGFSATSLAILNKSISPATFQSGAVTAYDLLTPGRANHPLTILLEEYQISQSFASLAEELQIVNRNEISKFITQLNSFEHNNGPALMVGLFTYQGGHAIVPFASTTDAAGNYLVSIYDNNYPGQTRTMTIGKNMNTWSYEIQPGMVWKQSDANAFFGFIQASKVHDLVVYAKGYYANANMNVNSSIPNSNVMMLNANTEDITIHRANDPAKKDIKEDYRFHYAAAANYVLTSSFILPSDEYVISFKSSVDGEVAISYSTGDDGVYVDAVVNSDTAIFDLTSDKNGDKLTISSVEPESKVVINVMDAGSNGAKKTITETVSTSLTIDKPNGHTGVNVQADGKEVISDSKPAPKPSEGDDKPDDTGTTGTDNTTPQQPETPAESITLEFTIDSQMVLKNGDELPELDVPAMIINGRTMIPFRYFIETALGGVADFNADTYVITATVRGHTIVMTVDDPIIYVDGEPITMTQAPTIVDSRTLVPLRLIESIAQSVGWDPATRKATIIL